MTTQSERTTIHFSRGIPPPEAIPARELAKLTAAVLDEAADTVFQYAPIGRHRGDRALREQLGAFHAADPEHIFVGNGSLQVLDLLAGHLLASGRPVVFVESPTYDRAAEIFQRHGARVVGLPVEPDGVDIDALRRALRAEVPALFYTIPDFQNPSGVTMSEPKRRAVVELAAKYGFPVVEDIPYRELRYHGEAPPALAGIAGTAASVITLGSLSKVLSPGLRVGYAISDPPTATALAARAEGVYLSPAPLCQAVAARCLASGLVRSNIVRTVELLRPRHDAAVLTARNMLGDGLLAVPDGGYYLGARLPAGTDEPSLLAAAQAAGIVLTAGSGFRPPPGTVFLRLPFHALDAADFAYGLERLVAIANRLMTR
jgi:2-aminoadipate transaminase